MTILTITDGTTSCNLIWHSTANRNYILAKDGWAPAVPPRRARVVEEEIELHVLGDTAAIALANLGRLALLLDQAERWAADESGVDPVKVQYQPNGGTRVLEALIVGRASGDQTENLSLPMTMNSTLNAMMIEGVRVRFMRRAKWLDVEEDVSASSFLAVPDVMTRTFTTSHTTRSPLAISIEQNGSNTLDTPGTIIVTKDTSNLLIAEAETIITAAASGSLSTVADGNFCRGSNVRRYTPASASTFVKLTLGNSWLSALADAETRAMMVFLALRNNSASATWQVRLAPYKAARPLTKSTERLVDTSTTQPRVMALGPIYAPAGFQGFDLEISVSTVSGSPTIDFDYVVAVGIPDEETTRIISYSNVLNSSSLGVSAISIIHPDLIETAKGVVTTETLSTTYKDLIFTDRLSYDGDIALQTIGSTVAAMLLATDGAAWRNNASGSAIQTRLSVGRRKAHHVPI